MSLCFGNRDLKINYILKENQLSSWTKIKYVFKPIQMILLRI